MYKKGEEEEERGEERHVLEQKRDNAISKM